MIITYYKCSFLSLLIIDVMNHKIHILLAILYCDCLSPIHYMILLINGYVGRFNWTKKQKLSNIQRRFSYPQNRISEPNENPDKLFFCSSFSDTIIIIYLSAFAFYPFDGCLDFCGCFYFLLFRSSSFNYFYFRFIVWFFSVDFTTLATCGADEPKNKK